GLGMGVKVSSRLARPLWSTLSVFATSRIASNRRTFSSRYGAASRIVEDVMRLELRYRSDIDLSQPAMQVEIRSHIARCLRDLPQGGEGVRSHLPGSSIVSCTSSMTAGSIPS